MTIISIPISIIPFLTILPSFHGKKPAACTRAFFLERRRVSVLRTTLKKYFRLDFSLRKFFLFFSVFGYFDILWDCFGPWKQRFYKIICQCLSGHCFKQIFYIFKGDKPVHDCSLCYTVEDDNLIFDEPDSKDFYDGLVELILDTVMSSKKRITIAGNDIPTEVVKSKLLKLDSEHIKYVEHCMDNTTTDIRNIKQYLLSVLYNAPTTMSSYYQAWVNRDNAMAKI